MYIVAMVSNPHSSVMVETISASESPSATEILIVELKSCLDALQQEQEMYRNFDEADEIAEGNADSLRYKWLADTEQTNRPSKPILDDLTVSEITDICHRINDDAEIVSVLREMHSQAHLGVTPGQLLAHVKYLLSESLVSHKQRCAEQQYENGRSTPTGGRHLSFSGVLAGLKAFRRNKASASLATGHTNNEFDIEARQTTV